MDAPSEIYCLVCFLVETLSALKPASFVLNETNQPAMKNLLGFLCFSYNVLPKSIVDNRDVLDLVKFKLTCEADLHRSIHCGS